MVQRRCTRIMRFMDGDGDGDGGGDGYSELFVARTSH
jgi:hypothetical protein